MFPTVAALLGWVHSCSRRILWRWPPSVSCKYTGKLAVKLLRELRTLLRACNCLQWTWPIETHNILCSKSHTHFLFPRSLKKSVNFRGPVWHFITSSFLPWVVSSSSNPKAVGPPLISFPRLLIPYICSYPPFIITHGEAMLWWQGPS
jgi:hypothetical protein